MQEITVVGPHLAQALSFGFLSFRVSTDEVVRWSESFDHLLSHKRKWTFSISCTSHLYVAVKTPVSSFFDSLFYSQVNVLPTKTVLYVVNSVAMTPYCIMSHTLVCDHLLGPTHKDPFAQTGHTLINCKQAVWRNIWGIKLGELTGLRAHPPCGISPKILTTHSLHFELNLLDMKTLSFSECLFYWVIRWGPEGQNRCRTVPLVRSNS